MKQYISIAAIFTFLLMSIPTISLINKPDITAQQQTFTEIKTESGEPQAKDVFLVLDYTTGQVSEISLRDYLIGAVSAEMPASFEPEALKAQAVAAHTYAVRQREKEKLYPTPELNGAYFSNDSTKYQAFYSESDAKKIFGDDYESRHEKISGAVDEVLNEIIVYQNEPIVAAFHSMSSGRTESAENIWGNPVDYLIPVDSSEDTLAENYTEEVIMTPDEISARLITSYDDLQFGEDKSRWFEVVERSESGTVTALKTGNIAVKGTDFRIILNLRSANFDINYDGENFHIITRGYGHGVGMSQYGANAMALQGKSYKDILEHYYPNTKIITA